MDAKNGWSATFGGRLRREVAQFFDFANGGSHEEFLKKSEKNVSSEHPRRTATPVHCVYLAPTI